MKRIIIALCVLCAWSWVACDPIEDEHPQGTVLSESDLDIEVYPLTEGGNKIVMINNTPNVAPHWNYGSGISVRQNDTVLIPFLGDTEITFTGMCSGGTVSTTRTVPIEQMTYPVAEEYILFAGTDITGKTWMWDYEDPSDPVWGNGGYPGDKTPTWMQVTAEGMNSQPDPAGMEGTMIFDLNGGANFTKVGQTGEVLETGIFSFDMTPDDIGWSIGKLTITGATVLNGFCPNIAEGDQTIHTFDILELTEDRMVLAYVRDGWEGWYWNFKVKE